MLLVLSTIAALAGEGSTVAECPEAPLVVAQASAAQVEMAYVNADETAFFAARWSLEKAIPCIDTEIALPDAITLHRARAITSYVDGDLERSRRSFAAIRTLQPDWTPPLALMPKGHDLRRLWDESTVLTEVVPLPENQGGFNVDGTRATDVPSQRAFVLQGFSTGGETLVTRYCEYTDCLDEAAKVAIEGNASRKQTWRRQTRILGVSVGGLALAGGLGAMVIAADARHDLFAETDDALIEGHEQRARGAQTLGSVGALAGLGVVGAVVAFTW